MNTVPSNRPKGIFGHIRNFVTNLFRKEQPPSSPSAPAYTAPREKESEEIIQFRRSINTLLQKIDTTLSQPQEKETDVHPPKDPWQDINLTPKQNKPHTRVNTFNPRRFSPPSLYDLFKAREARRNAEEVRRKTHVIQKKKQEQPILKKLAALECLLVRKDNWKEFRNILLANGITTFYHFTDRSNIASIKKHGGLFSWYYCQRQNINIPASGASDTSRRLDQRYDLEDYVRLSFCKEHPMKYIALKQGRITDPVLLEIDIEVAYWKHTRFSDMNATKTGHEQGTQLEDLKRIDFYIVKRTDYNYLNEFDKASYQAEVMVKTFIPLKYIKNINEY